MTAYIVARALDGVFELVDELGGSSTALIQSVGVSRHTFDNGDSPIPYSLYGEVIEQAVHQLNRPDFALMLAKKRVQSNYARELAIFVSSATSLKQALEGLIDHLKVRTLGVQYNLQINGQTVTLSRMVPPRESARYPQVTILWTATAFGILSNVSTRKLQLSSVNYTFKDSGAGSALRAYFQCPVQFNAELDTLNFAARDLDLPIATRDEELHDLLTDYLRTRHIKDAEDFTEMVKRLIRINLLEGKPNIEALSDRLQFRPRTIQQKLKESGTSYTALLNEVRFELAEGLLLQSDTSLTDIAQRLCFRELSAFSRAFRKRYGMSPRQWKVNARQARQAVPVSRG